MNGYEDYRKNLCIYELIMSPLLKTKWFSPEKLGQKSIN